MDLPPGVVVLGPGESRTAGALVLKATGADTGGAYALRENVIPPGFADAAPHRHAAVEEGWYVLEGAMTFLVERQRVLAPAGTFVLVPRGVTHAFTNCGTTPARFLVLFSPPGFEAMFEELHARRGAAGGRLDPAQAAAIQARYGMEQVRVPSDVWPP